MSALPPSAIPFHVFDDLSTLGKARGVGRFVRHRDQQEINRHAEREGDLLMQRNGTFALSCLEVRQVPLGNTNAYDHLGLRHIPPLAQYSDGILAGRQPIDNGLGQHDLLPACKRRARTTHDPGHARILANSQCREPLVFTLGKNGEFLAARGLDELNLGHDGLSVVNLAAMPDGGDYDGIVLDVKDQTPVARTQPHAGTPLETLYFALASLGERQKLGIEPPSHVGGEAEPLTCGRTRKDDLNASSITYCDILVKKDIAHCYIEMRT
jgi:hypothetical protein